MTTDQPCQTRYSSVAAALHWAIALLILFNLGLGYFMESFSPALKYAVVTAHISSGLTVLALSAARILWRLTHRPPPHPEGMRPWEIHAALIAHFLLYVAMVVIPLTGLALVSANPPPGSAGARMRAAAMASAAHPHAAPHGKPQSPPVYRIWWVLDIPRIKPLQEIGRTAEGYKPQKDLHDQLAKAHGEEGFLLILLLLAHVAGALKHQFIDGQAEFARMWVGRARR